ncbi:CPBP family glutamic-type intramembrane protease, partial [Staphylococcus epidermidis]|uniref:CPBP family glutamic-type intramembrane protease n=1 Tax=Staphylococcus epidermidis TaxID=1282 RepID=UPI0037DA1EE7
MFIPFPFLLILILPPILQQFLFTHFLIPQLPKNFNFILIPLISPFSFTYIHLTHPNSPFQFPPYLILPIPLLYLYLKSNTNLTSSITLHI